MKIRTPSNVMRTAIAAAPLYVMALAAHAAAIPVTNTNDSGPKPPKKS